MNKGKKETLLLKAVFPIAESLFDNAGIG